MRVLHDIGSALRSRGFRVTPQRRAIYELLEEHGGHISADELYSLARTRQLRVSLSTVYRALDLFQKLGLVRALRVGDQHLYEIKKEEEHHHLICLGCGKVIEFRCEHCGELFKVLAKRYDFQVTGSRVQLLGYCSECRRKAKGKEEG